MKSIRLKRLGISLIFFLVGAGFSAAAIDDQSLRIKEFVVMGYEGIRLELRSGNGPYLKTLTDLLNVPPTDSAKTIDQIRSFSKTFPNIMDFSDQVVALRKEQKGPAGTMETSIPIPTGPGIYSGNKLENALSHLTRGMNVTVYLKTGEQVKGGFAEYNMRRLWLRGADRRSFLIDDILAIEAPQL